MKFALILQLSVVWLPGLAFLLPPVSYPKANSRPFKCSVDSAKLQPICVVKGAYSRFPAQTKDGRNHFCHWYQGFPKCCLFNPPKPDWYPSSIALAYTRAEFV
ncbi:hypothetical protein O181_102301 [Austropuccinia psidii MF-1]|uniref:Secreted protein n=1 Tax=Austropuccinia psidii MF-1 TaxID=1389203 RepID=A0A9Q3JIE0_9BASI|nr:hypothetical protein [Austropuccinia psidii MF-1]